MPVNGTFTLYTAEESVISFQTLTFIDLRVIAQHTEEALKTPLMPSGVNSTLTHPFFLISTDRFEAHVLGVDHCGVRGINSYGLRLNRPHMATKHTHPQIHRWVHAGGDRARSSRAFDPLCLIQTVKRRRQGRIFTFHRQRRCIYETFVLGHKFCPHMHFFCWLVLQKSELADSTCA